MAHQDNHKKHTQKIMTKKSGIHEHLNTHVFPAPFFFTNIFIIIIFLSCIQLLTTLFFPPSWEATQQKQKGRPRPRDLGKRCSMEIKPGQNKRYHINPTRQVEIAWFWTTFKFHLSSFTLPDSRTDPHNKAIACIHLTMLILSNRISSKNVRTSWMCGEEAIFN